MEDTDHRQAATDGPGPRRRVSVWVWLAVATVLSLVAAMMLGSVRTGFVDSLLVVLHSLGLPVSLSDVPEAHQRILAGLRVPRVFVGALAGALLGLAGTLHQGALRDPLAGPVTTGAAAGALLGSTVALAALAGRGVTAGAAAQADWLAFGARALVASGVAAFATFVVVASVRMGRRVAVGPLLLAGLAVNALVGSLAAWVLFLGTIGTQTAATVVVVWTFGGLLQEVALGALPVLLVVLLGTVFVTMRERSALDQILVGEDEAAAAGVPVARTRRIALWAAAVATGAAVAAAGVLAFVGLVAPIVARALVGPSHRSVAPAAALLGVMFVVLADGLGRWIAAPAEIPAGVVTATVGAPILLFLLIKRFQGVAS